MQTPPTCRRNRANVARPHSRSQPPSPHAHALDPSAVPPPLTSTQRPDDQLPVLQREQGYHRGLHRERHVRPPTGPGAHPASALRDPPRRPPPCAARGAVRQPARVQGASGANRGRERSQSTRSALHEGTCRALQSGGKKNLLRSVLFVGWGCVTFRSLRGTQFLLLSTAELVELLRVRERTPSVAAAVHLALNYIAGTSYPRHMKGHKRGERNQKHQHKSDIIQQLLWGGYFSAKQVPLRSWQ